MAKCQACNLEMAGPDGAKSCGAVDKAPYIEYPDGKKIKAIPYGDPNDLMPDQGERCHDCNVAKGGYHHPGCDAERCPRCQSQLIMCDCLDEAD